MNTQTTPLIPAHRPSSTALAVLLTAALGLSSAFGQDQNLVQTIRDQPSWVIRNDQIEIAVTQLGAHMAPVTFYRHDAAPVRPYHVSPWQGEKLDISVPVLVPLRGDFFCLPFGGNGTPYRGEQHPPHGEIVGAPWTLLGVESAAGVTSLNLAIATKVRPGKVTEQLSLVDGQNVVYTKTTIEGFAGKTSLAHHAILAMPEKEGVIKISTSPILFGMTCPYPFSNAAQQEYQSLAIGAKFADLAKVPVIFKDRPDTDCTAFPARRGFADLLEVFSAPSKTTPAWITAVNTDEHWLWFALKDPTILPGRVFWMENHGRYDSPWNGRNNCLGVEDGCTFFDQGIAESSAENVITRLGVPTSVELKGDKPFVVTYIQGVVKVPAGFDKVASVEFKPGTVEFVSTQGQRVSASVRHEFIWDGKLVH